jgi:hypothetical protein
VRNDLQSQILIKFNILTLAETHPTNSSTHLSVLRRRGGGQGQGGMGRGGGVLGLDGLDMGWGWLGLGGLDKGGGWLGQGGQVWGVLGRGRGELKLGGQQMGLLVLGRGMDELGLGGLATGWSVLGLCGLVQGGRDRGRGWLEPGGLGRGRGGMRIRMIVKMFGIFVKIQALVRQKNSSNIGVVSRPLHMRGPSSLTKPLMIACDRQHRSMYRRACVYGYV